MVLLDPTDKGLAGGDETVLRYELCLPVAGEAPAAPAADLVELEGGRFARSVFTGLYEDGYRFAYARQLEWLADSGRGLRGRLRMRFVRDERDTADPADFATELIWPVTEPAARRGAEERPPDLTHGWLRAVAQTAAGAGRTASSRRPFGAHGSSRRRMPTACR